MQMVIAGGTGFIGQALVQRFLALGHHCVVIGRHGEKIKQIFGNQVIGLSWDGLATQASQILQQAHLIINLAGANIGDHRWTRKRRKEILNSRIIPTQTLAQYCAALGKHSPPLFNASAIGVYGLQARSQGELPQPLTEQFPINFQQYPDFLSQVGRQWESATQAAEQAGVRVVKMRFGVVLGKPGGILAKLKRPYSLGLAGPLGDGQQPFSWIALPDLLAAIEFLFNKPDITGAVNLVAPQCVTQQQFAAAYAAVLHRPSFVRTPALAIKLLYGQMGDELLLNGQHVVPQRLTQAGFIFACPELKAALQTVWNSV